MRELGHFLRCFWGVTMEKSIAAHNVVSFMSFTTSLIDGLLKNNCNRERAQVPFSTAGLVLSPMVGGQLIGYLLVGFSTQPPMRWHK